MHHNKFFHIIKEFTSFICQICIIFSFGRPDDFDNVAAASRAWADDGAVIYAIGVGDGITQRDLERISGFKERTVKVKTLDDLDEIANSLRQADCMWGK